MGEMTEHVLTYSSISIYIITLLIQLGIFAKTSELKALEVKIMTYIAEHYVTDTTYRENHRTLQDQISQIQSDISDIKNILISGTYKRG